MIVPESNLRSVRSAGQVALRHTTAWVVGIAVLFAVVAWVAWVNSQIRYYATHDEARPADAIAVFGAAEYDGGTVAGAAGAAGAWADALPGEAGSLDHYSWRRRSR